MNLSLFLSFTEHIYNNKYSTQNAPGVIVMLPFLTVHLSGLEFQLKTSNLM